MKNAFFMARARCRNATNPAYEQYGGRGIEFRFDSYEEFAEEVGEPPSAKHSLNRIDNDGHYEKGNVEWATPKEQMRNTRKNLMVTFENRTHPLSWWCELLGLRYNLIYDRMTRGKSFVEAATTPLSQNKSPRFHPEWTPSWEGRQ